MSKNREDWIVPSPGNYERERANQVLESISKSIREAVKAERFKCARDICENCKRGDLLIEGPHGFDHETTWCDALEIHERDLAEALAAGTSEAEWLQDVNSQLKAAAVEKEASRG